MAEFSAKEQPKSKIVGNSKLNIILKSDVYLTHFKKKRNTILYNNTCHEISCKNTKKEKKNLTWRMYVSLKNWSNASMAKCNAKEHSKSKIVGIFFKA